MIDRDKKMEIKNILDQAYCLKNDGKNEDSLKMYSEAFDVLVAEASEYAKGLEEMFEDAEKKTVSKKYLEKFNEYLKKDKRACVISNNMGVLFARTGEKASAKIFFEQAIDLTPKGEKYDDPYIGLEVLNSKEQE
jgi:tetratricopeptide (TPR) repeat protein